jgi:long-chain acyl-CoA synthetase
MTAASIIGGPLDAFAVARPEATAIVCDDETTTWAALRRAVDALGNEMDRRAPSGRSIALLLPNSPLFLAAFLACARSGREAVVIDPAWPVARVRRALADLRPALAFAEGEVEGVETIVCDPRAALPAGPQDNAFPARARPEDSFYVGFTSGSTGVPKGYRRSHRSWIESFDADATEFGVHERDVILAPGAMTHSLFLYAAVHALQIGATLLMCRAFRPGAVARLARTRRATVAYGAPTHWRMLIDADPQELGDLRWAFSSGAKWFADASKDLARLAPNAHLVEFYGASELSFVAVRKPGEGCPEDSVGRPFSGVRLTIRDGEGAALPAGRIGRVFVHSPFLFSGYATDDADIARHCGEMSVGDLGFLDERGFLHLVGRENRMIVTSGKNVFAEEIERALEAAPVVRAAAVIAVPDRRRGERIVALVLPSSDVSLKRDEISRHARAILPLPFVPRVLARARDWRWTASGKTDFAAMRDIWEAREWDLLR